MGFEPNVVFAATKRQIPFPVSWYCPVVYCSRSLADRHRINNTAMAVRLLRVVARTAHNPCAPQMLQQFLLQGTTGLDEVVR